MAKYRKILVAFDNSASAQNALSIASQLAREYKNWIKVLAIVPSYEGDLELIGVKNIKETIAGPGQELLVKAREIADAEGVHILTDLEQGEPYEQIVHVAAEENCDLIVMGRKGLDHLERGLMGSVTARVIGHTDKNVLVVPENAKLAWDNILLAADGSAYCKNATTLAIDMAKEHSARLTIINVVSLNDEFLALAPDIVSNMVDKAKSVVDAVVEEAKSKGLRKVESVVKEGEPYSAITKLASDRNADLIVMGTYGRKGITRLLMGSVTERVIGYSKCPVMVSP
jgi:nucleotide-binding universal stress UspA family protein